MGEQWREFYRGSGLSVDSPLPSPPNLEQGVLMDGSELGDFDDLDLSSSEIF